MSKSEKREYGYYYIKHFKNMPFEIALFNGVYFELISDDMIYYEHEFHEIDENRIPNRGEV